MDYRAAIIEMLEKADAKRLSLIYRYVRALLGL